MAVFGTNLLTLVPLAVAVAVVVLLCRWVFGRHGVRRVVGGPDYGLLSPVARRGSREEAEAARDLLLARGIRATVAPAGKGYDSRGVAWPTGSFLVLVFPSDVEPAIALLADHPQPR